MQLSDWQFAQAYEFAWGDDLVEDINTICKELRLPEAVRRRAIQEAHQEGMQKGSQPLKNPFGEDPNQGRHRWLAAHIVARAASIVADTQPAAAPQTTQPPQVRPTQTPAPMALLLILPPNIVPSPSRGGRSSEGEVADLNLARGFWYGPATELAPLEANARSPRGPQQGEVSLVQILFSQPDPRFDAESTSARRRAALRDLPADSRIAYIGNVGEADSTLLDLDPRNW